MNNNREKKKTYQKRCRNQTYKGNRQTNRGEAPENNSNRNKSLLIL